MTRIRLRNRVLRITYGKMIGKDIQSITEIPSPVISYLIDIGHVNLLRPIIMRELTKFKTENGQNKQGRATIAKKWGVSQMYVRNIGREIQHYKK